MEIVAALIGVGGSVLIALAVYLAGIVMGRRTATMDLLREFHSAEMSAVRARARNFVLRHSGSDFDQLNLLDLATDDERREREALFMVSRFFYRLNILRKSSLLADGKLLDLFGPPFAFWWAFSFQNQLHRSTWSMKVEIEELHAWLYEKANGSRRGRDWTNWCALGSTDLKSPVPSASAADARSEARLSRIEAALKLEKP